jgi:AmiR/NasT family two-component response regulator
VEVSDSSAAEERIQHLLLALEHRTVIGQATGIVMERYTLGPEAAFGVLLRVSQERNQKVYDIAQRLVEKGRAEEL